MPTYSYQAKNQQGTDISGQIDAADTRQAAAELQKQGLFILNISAISDARPSSAATPANAGFSSVIGVKQRLQVWTQLHTALQSGMTISDSLKMIGGWARGKLKIILTDAARRTGSGETFSSVLERYPGAFPEAEIALIKAGEMSGQLVASVQALEQMNQDELELRRMFIAQTAYPVGVLIVAALVFAITWQGPANFVNVIRSYYAPGAAVLAAGFFGFRFLLNSSASARSIWDQMKMLIPGVGSIVRKLAAAKAASVLGAGYKSGLNMATSLELAAKSCGNAHMSNKMMSAVEPVRRGESMAQSLARAGALPPHALQFLETGERTGNLDQMMEQLSRFFRAEAVSALKVGAIAAGIVAMIVAAVVVFFIVARFYIGMYGGMLQGI